MLRLSGGVAKEGRARAFAQFSDATFVPNLRESGGLPAGAGLPIPIVDLYDELAEAAAEDDDGCSRRIEVRLRRLRSALRQRPSVAPIVVEGLVEWAATEGQDPDSG